jgi:hypothetical protein
VSVISVPVSCVPLAARLPANNKHASPLQRKLPQR